ncbi:hypothetical protein EJP77_09980 [Paenibacillus zeisoli]|uniref:Type 4 fimbrial biogenesis protein PilX N-terminal domain-containing protein n=1 Tax=Paenibacillus zeisoli TaxID=2496267 RepID=A0A433XC45_9BACL|nr:hypothetical protein [Paenibacillus zeisoli]RUT31709.1 hypothetical protein EJP77_09980 [Paenibacillus zeisoli]
MKRVQEERGSALVMVLFIVLVLTILGMGVLSATLGGAQRTETRESDVQSLHLAQKSIDEAVAAITTELEQYNDIRPEDLVSTINAVLSKINPENKAVSTGLNDNGIVATANAKILNIEYLGSSGPSNTNYKLRITVQAEVNGVVRKLKQEVTIDTYPDFLKYAMGSESNVIFNGAPYIRGNIYAGDKLMLSNVAEYVFKNKVGHQPTTGYSVIDPLNGLNSEITVQSLNSLVYRSGGQEVPYQSIDINKGGVVGQVLGANVRPQDIKIKDHKKFVQINVNESIVDKVVEAIKGAGHTDELTRQDIRSHLADLVSHLISQYSARFEMMERPVDGIEPNYPSDSADAAKMVDYEKALKGYNDQHALYVQTLNDQRSRMSSMAGSAIFKKGLKIDGNLYSTLTYKPEEKDAGKWFIVDGDLTIDNSGRAEAMNIRGNIIVTGNVILSGKVNMDSTMFVMGQTKVQDATISGLGGKELVLISRGEILVTRFDSFQNAAPQTLDAFFYTDSTAELYGVGSAFWLNGGFFAKGDLTVNAVVGSAVDQNDHIEFNEHGAGELKRFNVTYNSQVFEDQKLSLPRVQRVNIRLGELTLQ